MYLALDTIEHRQVLLPHGIAIPEGIAKIADGTADSLSAGEFGCQAL
jgi:hypothetical protein